MDTTRSRSIREAVSVYSDRLATDLSVRVNLVAFFRVNPDLRIQNRTVLVLRFVVKTDLMRSAIMRGVEYGLSPMVVRINSNAPTVALRADRALTIVGV